MEVLYKDIMQLMHAFLLPLFRIAAIFMIAPGLSSNMVPTRIRAGIAVVITLPVVLTLPAPTYEPSLSPALLVMVAQQILIGIAIGFVLQLILQMVIVGAQALAMQMGLGFAAMVDPQSGSSVPLMGQFHLMMATLLFLAFDGHLLAIKALVASFDTIPIGMQGLAPDAYWKIVLWGKTIFSTAILMALPSVAALLLVNFSFGIMTRAAPQLNIFAVGFPVTLSLGIFVVMLNLVNVGSHVESMTNEAFLLIQAITSG